MLNLITDFVGELRAVGVPVSLTESLDALAAMRHTPLADRRSVRLALGTALIKDQQHWSAFALLFDVFFTPDAAAPEPSVAPAAPGPAGRPGARRPVLRSLDHEQLSRVLLAALLAGDRTAIGAIAVEAVTRYSTIEPARPITGRYYVYRTLRSLDFDALPGRLATAERARSARAPVALERRLAHAEHAERLGYLRGRIEAEVTRRLVAAQGTEAIARTFRKPLPENAEFLHASNADLDAMHAALQPLTRRLAVRLIRQHRPKGALDARATLRRSLSYGGVMADPVFRERRTVQPEIIVLADISGSVGAFAGFTLLVARAISARFSRVRSFVFIDTVAEITGMLAPDQPARAMVDRINRQAGAASVDGHSDYGHALETFWRRFGRDVSAQTIILILGDARNNHHVSQARVVRDMSRRARRVFWLNPEPTALWGTGDSIMAEYAPHCDAVAECRNLRQLEHFVTTLLLLSGTTPARACLT
jgi:uncharacterized protein